MAADQSDGNVKIELEVPKERINIKPGENTVEFKPPSEPKPSEETLEPPPPQTKKEFRQYQKMSLVAGFTIFILGVILWPFFGLTVLLVLLFIGAAFVGLGTLL